jgi:hypothetical protein
LQSGIVYVPGADRVLEIVLYCVVFSRVQSGPGPAAGYLLFAFRSVYAVPGRDRTIA